jgi:hypothetical protein
MPVPDTVTVSLAPLECFVAPALVTADLASPVHAAAPAPASVGPVPLMCTTAPDPSS